MARGKCWGRVNVSLWRIEGLVELLLVIDFKVVKLCRLRTIFSSGGTFGS